jgi:cell division protein FtsI (penicillin-binding protein 3)
MGERRLMWLAGVAALWGAAIFGSLVKLEVLHHKEYVRIAHRSQEIDIPLSAPRGPILDRGGQPLAMSVSTEKVTVNPLKVPDLQVASDLLALILHLDRAELYAKMLEAHDHGRGYLVVKPKITFEEGKNLRALQMDWMDIERKSERHYPGGTLAAHVLGSVDFDEKGNAGVEKSLNADLLGSPGHERLLTDVKRRGISAQAESDAKPGLPVTLTIDERLQYIAERELAAAVETHHARTGSVVVMNPQTGDILALASYPTYDPNIPPVEGDNPIGRQNHAVSVPFEPGSVFKVITLSAALETTNLTPDSPINCHGGILTLYGRTIHDSHVGAFGILPMSMVLAHSSNIGAIEVGLRVGQTNMYDYAHRFGFGQRTGVPLPAESAGKLRKLARWSSASLPSISMGQEVSVTTLQLARAACAIANGGLLVQPRLILKKGDRTVAPAAPVRIIRPETAITMRQMMEGVVLYGTGRLVAKLQGYTSGGKTGSAQIFDTATRHYSHIYNGSFMGFAPVTNPAIVVVATVNGTHGTSGFGGPTAGPVFRAVTTEALRLLDVPKDLPEQEATPLVLVADTTDNADDLADTSLADDQPNILDDPEDDAAASNDQPNAVRVPDFRGMTMRAVLAAAASKGMTVLPDGSGVARLQSPPAGSILHEGERIRVRFAR